MSAEIDKSQELSIRNLWEEIVSSCLAEELTILSSFLPALSASIKSSQENLGRLIEIGYLTNLEAESRELSLLHSWQTKLSMCQDLIELSLRTLASMKEDLSNK